MMLEIHEWKKHNKERHYESLCPLFAWLPTECKRTFQATMQYVHFPISNILQKHYKSQFPALNVNCRQVTIATDTVFADTLTVNNGSNSHKSLLVKSPLWLMFMAWKPTKSLLTSLRILSDNMVHLIGKNFLMGSQEDGQQNRPKIVELIKDHLEQLEIILPSSNWNAIQ